MNTHIVTELQAALGDAVSRADRSGGFLWRIRLRTFGPVQASMLRLRRLQLDEMRSVVGR